MARRPNVMLPVIVFSTLLATAVGAALWWSTKDGNGPRIANPFETWPKHVATFREHDPTFMRPRAQTQKVVGKQKSWIHPGTGQQMFEDVYGVVPKVDENGKPVLVSGDWTPVFKVDDDWEVRWECRVSPESIELLDSKGEHVGFAKHWYGEPRSTSGTKVMRGGGEFRLRVVSNGHPWKIEVWQNSGRIE